MSNLIPTDTPARLALIDLLVHDLVIEDAGRSESTTLRRARSDDEDDAAALAHWLDATARALDPEGHRRPILRAASAEIHETLRARGLLVTSRGKLARIVDDNELERRYQVRREAGEDSDARRDDHERGGR